MKAALRAMAVGLLMATLACGGGDTGPAPLDARNETCASCRMPVSDPKLAAQLVAPGEEPRFFDDIGCLRDFLLRNAATLPAGTVAFVADHQTGGWIRASAALYSRCPAIETPMASHLVAHADARSLAADATASACASTSATEVFGPAGAPDGRKTSALKP